MCRHLGYLGPPVILASLLYDPPQSLLRQSWAPRQQRHGTVNADGYGVGWYAPSLQAKPARYRRAGPMWADRSLESLARVVTSTAVVAAVRSATPPAPIEESGAAPFTAGRWLFSLNGTVGGDLVSRRQQVSARRQAGIEGSSDAEVLFALLLDRLDRGVSPPEALADLVATVPGRLNILLADGASLWATAWGDTLWWRRVTPAGDSGASVAGDEVGRRVTPAGGSGGSAGGEEVGRRAVDEPRSHHRAEVVLGGADGAPPSDDPAERGVIVASEPLDDDPAWTAVADRSLLSVTSAAGAAQPVVRSLAAPFPTPETDKGVPVA